MKDRDRGHGHGEHEGLRIVCEAAIKLGQTLEMRKVADWALEFFLQVTNANGAALYLQLDRGRFYRVGSKGEGLSSSRIRSIDLPGLAEDLARMAGPRQLADLPKHGSDGLAELRRSLKGLGADWLVPLKSAGQPMGLVCLAGGGATGSIGEKDRKLLHDLAQITASALSNARSYEMAIFDEPTGLLSARYYQLRLREELRRAIRHRKDLSLLLARIDGLAGDGELLDTILRERAESLRDLIRADLDIPARYGEYEFAVILPDTGIDGARVLAGRIYERLNSAIDGIDALTVSVGVAAYPHHADTVEELSDFAERALREATASGTEPIVILPPKPLEPVDYEAMRRS